MELDADRSQLSVPHGHHLAVVGECRRLEHVGQARRGERVVAPGFERIRQAREEPVPVVPHRAGLAVDELARVADLAAAGLDDRLVAETDSQHRRCRQQTPDDLAQGSLYPALPRIREVSARIAAAVADVAYQRGLAEGPAPNDVKALVQSQMYEPNY